MDLPISARVIMGVEMDIERQPSELRTSTGST